MIKANFIKQIEAMSDEHFEKLAPYFEADMAAFDRLSELHQEIDRGLQSAKDHPIHDSADVFSQIRKELGS